MNVIGSLVARLSEIPERLETPAERRKAIMLATAASTLVLGIASAIYVSQDKPHSRVNIAIWIAGTTLISAGTAGIAHWLASPRLR